jgi:hypothetical protein
MEVDSRNGRNWLDQPFFLSYSMMYKLIIRFVYLHHDVGRIGCNYAVKRCSKKPVVFHRALFSLVQFHSLKQTILAAEFINSAILSHKI